MTELRTEIKINAAAERVWSALLDFDRYPEWNPFIREISGTPAVGSILNVFIKPEGGMGAKLAPIVVASDVNRKFAWKGKFGVSGVFDGQHEFIIEALDDGKVNFVQREEFSGLLVPVLWPMLRKNTERGFNEMNQALKTLVGGN